MNTAQISLWDEIIVDNFAGGGGASTGIELALGRPVTIAINHDPAAILMHKTNHPWKCAKCGRVVRTHDRHKPQFWCVDCREAGDDI